MSLAIAAQEKMQFTVFVALCEIRNAMLPPLVVYSKVFGPAIVALLLVFAGGQMVRDNRIIQGFLVMWSGNLAVLATCNIAASAQPVSM